EPIWAAPPPQAASAEVTMPIPRARVVLIAGEDTSLVRGERSLHLGAQRGPLGACPRLLRIGVEIEQRRERLRRDVAHGDPGQGEALPGARPFLGILREIGRRAVVE